MIGMRQGYSRWIREYPNRVVENIFHSRIYDSKTREIYEAEACFAKMRRSRPLIEKLFDIYTHGDEEELVETAWNYGVDLGYFDIIRCLKVLGRRMGLINTRKKSFKKMYVRRWNPHEEELLREMISQGLKKKEIAEKMGRTPKSVYARAYQLGLVKFHRRGEKSKEWSKEEDEKLRELYSKGVPASEIARILNRPLQGVYARARVLGLKRYKSGGVPSREEIIKWACLRERGYSPYKISKITGRSYNTIRKYLDELDITPSPEECDKLLNAA